MVALALLRTKYSKYLTSQRDYVALSINVSYSEGLLHLSHIFLLILAGKFCLVPSINLASVLNFGQLQL